MSGVLRGVFPDTPAKRGSLKGPVHSSPTLQVSHVPDSFSEPESDYQLETSVLSVRKQLKGVEILEKAIKGV